MFGKSFSQVAVDRASIHVTCLDERSSDLFTLYPPSLSNNSDEKSNDKFIKTYNETPSAKLAFAAGFSHTICAHFFDGRPHHLEEFIKRVIIKTFNYGFMMNMGKSMYKSFSDPQFTNSEFYKLGCEWTRDSYIKEFVNGKGTIDDLLVIHEAREEYRTERFYDPQAAFDTAQQAAITRKEHKAWCTTMIHRLESDFSENGEFSDQLISGLQKLKGDNSQLKTALQVYYFYEDLCSAADHQKRVDIVKAYDSDNDSLFNLKYDKEDREDETNYEDNFKFDEANRYEHYLALWQIEKKLPQSSIFSSKFIEEISSLDLVTDLNPDIENENLRQAYSDSQFTPDLKFYFEIIGSIHHLLLDQGLRSECNFNVPVHEPVKDLDSYPAAKKFNFFDLKSKIIKNDGYFNFSMINTQYPKFGRIFVDPNLGLGVAITINHEEDSYSYFDIPSRIFRSRLFLKSKISEEDILKKKSKINKLHLSQEMLSINKQIKNGYGNTFQRRNTNLNKLIKEFNEYENHYLKDQKNIYDYLISNSENLLEKAKIKEEFSTLTESDFIIPSPQVGNLYWDNVFEIYDDTEERRNEYFKETGFYYDPFEYSHLKKFKELGLPINPQLLRKGLGLLPVTVKLALRLERMFLYFSNQQGTEEKFDGLLYEIDDIP